MTTLAMLRLLGLLSALPDEDGDKEMVGPPPPVPDCYERLGREGIVFRRAELPIHRVRGGNFLCGADQVVRYVRGPSRLRWGASPKVTCAMALALGKLEIVVQEEAKRHLGREVERIDHVGTYSCREMSAYPGWVSEHSYANAIDIRSFVLRSGTEITVGRHYGRVDGNGRTREQRFLRAVARRLVDEQVFSVVLTPRFDAAHGGHFHFDLARYEVDGT